MIYIFFAFIAYRLFRLIIDFIIPVYRTTKRVKQSFREMKQKMQEQANGPAQRPSTNSNGNPKKKEPMGDYIDFEEVKD